MSGTDTSPRRAAAQLALPEEPVVLRDAARAAVLAGGSWDDLVTGDGSVTSWLWKQWGGQLAPAGMDEASFAPVVFGYRRELWLWLMGERRWDHVLPGLVGRVARRLPAGSS